MHILAHENVSCTVIETLRDHGHDVLSVKESLRGEKDPAILARAQTEQRLLVTHD
jgi:predicted nuclease of predicted toxin-antitoxin system